MSKELICFISLIAAFGGYGLGVYQSTTPNITPYVKTNCEEVLENIEHNTNVKVSNSWRQGFLEGVVAAKDKDKLDEFLWEHYKPKEELK